MHANPIIGDSVSANGIGHETPPARVFDPESDSIGLAGDDVVRQERLTQREASALADYTNTKITVPDSNRRNRTISIGPQITKRQPHFVSVQRQGCLGAVISTLVVDQNSAECISGSDTAVDQILDG